MTIVQIAAAAGAERREADLPAVVGQLLLKQGGAETAVAVRACRIANFGDDKALLAVGPIHGFGEDFGKKADEADIVAVRGRYLVEDGIIGECQRPFTVLIGTVAFGVALASGDAAVVEAGAGDTQGRIAKIAIAGADEIDIARLEL